MRIVWLVFAGLVAALVLVVPRLGRHAAGPAPFDTEVPRSRRAVVLPAAYRATPFAALRTPPPPPSAQADSIVAFGLAQRGTPYVYAGTSPVTGFDCSGFIMYTFAHFGVAVPHSTALLIDVGQPVPRADAQPGDIVVFTGTAATSTTPGHAGIVISRRGESPLRFVHSSSARRESGVKVSQVEGSDYERRFMQVRRVLGSAALAAPRAKSAAVARTARAVPTLPAQPVAINLPETAPALPQALPKKQLARPTKALRAKKAATAARTKRPSHAASTAKKSAVKKATAKKQVSKSVAKKPVAKKPALRKPTTKPKTTKK